MKIKTLFIALLFHLLMGLNNSNATIITITAEGADINSWAFVPENPTVEVGDTIRWMNLNGVHTTASVSIPSGAKAWDANIPTDGVGYYDYVVEVEGVYEYTCHKSFNGGAGHGMDGAFITKNATATSIQNIENSFVSVAYPVPFSSSFSISVVGGDEIKLFTMNGELIKTIFLTNQEQTIEIDLNGLASGTYFYSIYEAGIIVETKTVIKE